MPYFNCRKSDITPEQPVFLAGFANRSGMSDSVHRPLKTCCVALRSEEVTVCMIFNDLMEIAVEYADRIRQIIAGATGIPLYHIFMMASHTHSAPVMDGMGLAWSDANQQYLDKTIQVIAENAIGTLMDAASFVGCRMFTGTALCGINANRREVDAKTGRIVMGKNENGPCDKEVRALQFTGINGQVLCTIFNYACHPVTLGPVSRMVSSDFVGKSEKVVAGYFGGEAIFMNGAAGDINPVFIPGANEQITDTAGVILGNAVNSIHFTEDTTVEYISLSFAQLALPYRDQEITEDYLGKHSEIIASQNTDFAGWKTAVMNWERKLRAQLNGSGVPNARLVHIGAVNIGSVVLVFATGEFFNSYQLALKKQFPEHHLLFAGYANGESGYVPDSAAFVLGGYEVDEAYVYLNEPSPLEPGAALICGEGLMRLIEKFSETNTPPLFNSHNTIQHAESKINFSDRMLPAAGMQ